MSTQAAKATDAVPEVWDRETDVVVVGTGYGGLPAAIEAKRAGADVLVLGKDDFPGGLSVFAGGHALLGATSIHRATGVNDTPQAWYEDEMKGTNYRAQPEIVRALSTRGDEFLEFFSELGIEFHVPSPNFLHPDIQRLNRSTYVKVSPGKYPGGWINGQARAGISLIYVMLQELEKLNVPVLLQHRMTRIYRPGYPYESGAVAGVQVETPQGTINIKTRRGIVLATGSALGNEQLCKGWEPRMVDEYAGAGDYYHEMWPHIQHTGDGHIAGIQVGGELAGMSYLGYLYFVFGTKKYANWSPTSKSDRTKWDTVPELKTGLPVKGDGWKRIVLVKYDGKRYVNENTGSEPNIPENWQTKEFARAYMNLREPGQARNIWGIVDADGLRALNWPVDHILNPRPDVWPSMWPDTIAHANTIEELAAKMKIPAGALKAEIDRYNGFVDAGKDADFGKPGPLHKIQTAPFYAARMHGIRHTSRNGLRVNSRAEVLDVAGSWVKGMSAVRSVDDEAVIAGLYAAGEVADPLGWRRTHGSVGPYVLMSLSAGRNAAARR